ncbi:MAG TPA: ABC transporter permease [Verrucomicrobiae bacterium]|nr:ABC transporter permease [Verrucomicrobiae bacterium]
MATRTTQRIINWLTPIIFIALVLAIWEGLVFLFTIPQYLLPAPTVIAFDFIKNFDYLIFHAGITLWEAFLGFIVANFLGIVIAIAFAHSKIFEKGIYPFAIALKTTPIIALAPILVLWFGNGISSKVVAAAFVSFFPAVVNTTKGLRSVDPDALELFKSLSASPWQIFSLLRFPAALPYIFSALKISTSLAVIGAIVGEFVGSNKGIGFVILVSSYHLEIVKMFSGVIAAALIGILFFGMISWIEKWVIFWTNVED